LEIKALKFFLVRMHVRAQ